MDGATESNVRLSVFDAEFGLVAPSMERSRRDMRRDKTLARWHEVKGVA